MLCDTAGERIATSRAVTSACVVWKISRRISGTPRPATRRLSYRQFLPIVSVRSCGNCVLTNIACSRYPILRIFKMFKSNHTFDRKRCAVSRADPSNARSRMPGAASGVCLGSRAPPRAAVKLKIFPPHLRTAMGTGFVRSLHNQQLSVASVACCQCVRHKTAAILTAGVLVQNFRHSLPRAHSLPYPALTPPPHLPWCQMLLQRGPPHGVLPHECCSIANFARVFGTLTTDTLCMFRCLQQQPMQRLTSWQSVSITRHCSRGVMKRTFKNFQTCGRFRERTVRRFLRRPLQYTCPDARCCCCAVRRDECCQTGAIRLQN